MTQYDFDEVIDRRGSFATKYEELEEKFGRSDIMPLWIADMDFATPQPVIDALHRCIDTRVLGYTTAPESFWDAIAGWLRRRHGWKLERSDIDFLPGVKKGFGLALNYFTSKGDRIVIQPPVYHSFRSVIEGNGRVVVDNPLIHGSDGSYRMDLEGLERIAAEEHPAMLVVCNPQNPAGVQWQAETLRQAAEICRRYNMILLSDEIYGDLLLDGRHHVPTAMVSDTAAEVTVTLGAPSKSFNIPGISSAWTVVKSPRLRDGFFAWLKASEFDTAPTCAIAATTAAYTQCDQWLDDVLAYIADNCRMACDYIAKNIPGLKVSVPEAGFGLWIDFTALGLSHDEICDRVFNTGRLAINSGVTFGAAGAGFMRLNAGVPRSELIKGLELLRAAFI
ncbi:MAG: PatB family C-S lyase [Muribaculaceae bacterium]|nr:PatB family C-S lyase [Muribaculaceae bacterium]